MNLPKKRIRLEDDDVASLPHDILLPTQVISLVRKAEASKYWQMLAYVDVSQELNPIRQACCRFCWGQDHQYQFTLNEFRLARNNHLFNQLKIRDPDDRVPFDELGGMGYDIKKPPHPDCPECHGFGVTIVVPIDLSKLSQAAKMLYDGVHITKDGGIEYKFRSRDRAMENLQKILGFDVSERKKNPLKDIDALPDEVLDEAITDAFDKGLLSEEDLSRISVEQG